MRPTLTAALLSLSAILIAPAALLRAEAPEDAAVATAADVVGTWDGHVDVFGQQLRMIFKVTRRDTGDLAATISIPAQMVSDTALDSVSLDAGKFVLEWNLVGAVWDLSVNADATAAEGLLKQNGMEFPAKLSKLPAGEEVDTTVNRPQTPKPPFPYETSEVEFRSRADDAGLVGTICIPEGDGPHPAVVFITGSGAQDRDETIFDHKPFLVLADDLARHGIASLRYDDRGVGGSEGDISRATADTFAGDVLGAIALLKEMPSIDIDHIGLIGHSEGGIIAPLVASRSPDVAFIVLMAGTGVPGGDVLKVQVRAILEASGVQPAEIARQLADQKKTLELIHDAERRDELTEHVRGALKRQMPNLEEEALDEMTQAQTAMVTSPWFVSFVDHDPRVALRRVTCPVLAINGSKDVQVVPSQNLPEIRAALEAAGNADVTIRELPGLNHMFQECTKGTIDEYAQIEQTIHPRVIEMIRDWIREKSGLAAE